MTEQPDVRDEARKAIALSLVDEGLVTSEERALQIVDRVLADPATHQASTAVAPAAEVSVERLLANPEVLAAACLRHGMHPDPSPAELFADVQHLVEPVVGLMHLDGETGYRVDRLTLVLALARRAQRADHDAGGPAAQARRLQEWQARVMEQMAAAMTSERYARFVDGTVGAADLAETIDALLADREELARLRATVARALPEV